ncbi:MAG: hypothetical protein D6725_09915 [Planctomycetota bacterium]|nr:MAG: hypothetical protein D6725_09915 [Planctomycetota bacterium]
MQQMIASAVDRSAPPPQSGVDAGSFDPDGIRERPSLSGEVRLAANRRSPYKTRPAGLAAAFPCSNRAF